MCDTSNKEKSQPILPIDPTFLSLAPEYQNKPLDDKKFNPNIHGLFDTTTLREFLAVMSMDLDVHSQLPLFQLVPSGFQFSDDKIKLSEIYPNKLFKEIAEERQLIRIDARAFSKGNPYCEVFKKDHKIDCAEYDSRVLLLFHKKLRKIDIDHDFSGYKTELETICDDFNRTLEQNDSTDITVNQLGVDRLYITYICGCSCFREYAFPVFHKGHIIAVIMIGQRLTSIQTNPCEGFLKKYPNLEVTFQCREDIKLFNPDHYAELDDIKIEEIHKRIKNLENRINNRVYESSRTILTRRFKEIENQFREDIARINSNREKEFTIDTGGSINPYTYMIDQLLERYKTALNKALKAICHDFASDEKIRIYAKELKISSIGNDHKFVLIGHSDDDITGIQKQLCYKADHNPSLLNKEELKKYCLEGISEEEKGKPYTFRKFNDYIDDFVILIYESFPDYLNDNMSYFRNHLDLLYHTLFEPYNILQTARLNKNLETSMRIAVHEASNVLPAIQYTLYNALELDDNLLELYIKTPSGIPKDIRPLWDVYQRTKLLDNIYKSSTVVFKDIKPCKDYHDLRRLIYSAITLSDEKAREDTKSAISVNLDTAYNIFNIYTDNNLMHQVLYNLTDNAVKYGYMGSRIYIDVKPDFYGRSIEVERWDTITISVTSYGCKIEHEEMKHLFDLFYRTHKSYYDNVEGMGIGLFLVKKMCFFMGYDISVSSTKISDYNIPVCYFYTKRDKDTINNENDEIKRILNMPINEEQMKAVNEYADWNIFHREMTVMINRPTYKNTFAITLRKNKDQYLLKYKYA